METNWVEHTSTGLPCIFNSNIFSLSSVRFLKTNYQFLKALVRQDSDDRRINNVISGDYGNYTIAHQQ